MKVYRNLSYIKARERLGRRITLAGLLVLLLGLAASFTPNWLPPDEPAQGAVLRFLQQYWAYISFGALAVGFLASSAGSYFINRFAPRRWPGTKQIARPDELIERSLKGFDDKYTLFLWALASAPYLLVGPPGIFVFVVRGDKAQVRVEGDSWRERFSLGRILTAFTREGLGNPSRELEETRQAVQELLRQGVDADQLHLDPAGVPVHGAVVFIHPRAQLTLESPTVPVLRPNEVKKFVRSIKGRPLNGQPLREVTEYLAGMRETT